MVIYIYIFQKSDEECKDTDVKKLLEKEKEDPSFLQMKNFWSNVHNKKLEELKVQNKMEEEEEKINGFLPQQSRKEKDRKTRKCGSEEQVVGFSSTSYSLKETGVYHPGWKP